MQTMDRHDGLVRPKRGPGLARWAAVLSGAVIGVGTFAALAAMWLMIIAIGGTNGTSFIADNVEWFLLGSGLLSAVVAGFSSGYLEDVRGAGAGMWTGLTSWALIVTATAVFLVPQAVGSFNGATGVSDVLRQYDVAMLVALFVTYAGGLGLAALGGSYGGAAKRPRAMYRVTPAAEREFEELASAAGWREADVVIREERITI